jgi:hypothetical protein
MQTYNLEISIKNKEAQSEDDANSEEETDCGIHLTAQVPVEPSKNMVWSMFTVFLREDDADSEEETDCGIHLTAHVPV